MHSNHHSRHSSHRSLLDAFPPSLPDPSPSHATLPRHTTAETVVPSDHSQDTHRPQTVGGKHLAGDHLAGDHSTAPSTSAIVLTMVAPSAQKVATMAQNSTDRTSHRLFSRHVRDHVLFPVSPFLHFPAGHDQWCVVVLNGTQFMAALRLGFESCDSAVVTESLSSIPAGFDSRRDFSSCATRRVLPRFPTVSLAGIAGTAGENKGFLRRFSTGIRFEKEVIPAVLASRDQTTSCTY